MLTHLRLLLDTHVDFLMGGGVDPVLGMSLLVFLGIDVFGGLVELSPSALLVTNLPFPLTVSWSYGSLCNDG